MAGADARCLVAESFGYGTGKLYELHAYVIMPNHVHVLRKPDQRSLADLVAS